MASSFLGFLMEQSDVDRVAQAITDAVARSYVMVGGRRTDAEDRRRSQLAIEIIRIGYGDMKWSILRTLDNLQYALNLRVQGFDWEPSKRQAWFGSSRNSRNA